MRLRVPCAGGSLCLRGAPSGRFSVSASAPRGLSRWVGEGCRMPPRPVVQAGQTLRVWQRKALMEYLRGKREDFLAVATPGAGKTTFALRVALELFGDGTIDNLTVVTPTEHLKTQWAEAAARVGI